MRKSLVVGILLILGSESSQIYKPYNYFLNHTTETETVHKPVDGFLASCRRNTWYAVFKDTEMSETD